jgi:succinate-semialdehyde dehydrogenase/glutarate-semialdehyde dehydrogenase
MSYPKLSYSKLSEMPLLKNLSGYVGGEFLSVTDTPIAVTDPANGQVLVRVPSFGESETTRAVECAEVALATPTTLAQRRGWLERVAAAHAEHREQLAQIITAENGKPIAEARGEVDYAAGFYAESARRIDCLAPRVLETTPKNHTWTVFARPAGVAGLIVPWNFPLAMLAKKASAALAAGTSIVVKPAEKTPLSSIALFHIFQQLALPSGMVNLVFGDAPQIGRVLCEHPAVRVISFTGSTAVGKLLSVQAAPHIKKMALELGGNAPFIVFEDADVEQAAEQLMSNKFRCSGQTCVCSNRVYVQSSIAHSFSQAVVAKVAALRVGPGKDESSQVGPLIDPAGFGKVRELVQDALEGGATAAVGGVADLPQEGAGLFYPPTVLDGVSESSRCLKDEVFGPIVPIVHFETEDDVVRAANDTEYGLAAYVFTKDTARAQRTIERLRFGHVGLNTGTGPTPEAPFGGMKQSGLGREGGDEGLLEYVELQSVPTPLPH